jgi:hypothetical protein
MWAPRQKKGSKPTTAPMWLNPPPPPRRCNDVARARCHPTYDGLCWHANRSSRQRRRVAITTTLSRAVVVRKIGRRYSPSCLLSPGTRVRVVGEHSHSKARHVSQSTVKTAQNVPVHFESKVRRTVEDAQNVPVHFVSKGETVQNVPVHFGSKLKHVSWSPIETVQNVPVHFVSKVRPQNVPVHFGSKVRKRLKCTTTF